MFRTQTNFIAKCAAVAAIAFMAHTPNSAHSADLYMPEEPVSHGPGTVVFTGFNAKEDAYFLYLGGVHAINGDLTSDGWLLRLFGGFGEYDYNAGALGNVDGDLVLGDLMAGYQWFEGAVRYSAYAGLNIADNDLSPNDPGNSTRGTEVGAKVQLEAETVQFDSYYVSGIASYATTHDDYWARLRVGHRFAGNYVLGPEGLVMGNDEYDQQRLGLFLNGIQLGSVNVGLSGGYAFVDGKNGDDSLYGAIDASFAF